MDTKSFNALLTTTKVLMVDDEPLMREVVKALLMSLGVCHIFEAVDGPSGLELIRTHAPDVVILDWNMPGLDGAAFMQIVRSPDTFPYAGVPVIMLTGHSERSRLLEAIKVGINEFLLKPVSQNALRERLVAVLTNPRPLVRHGDYYGPAPRRVAAAAVHEDNDQAIANLYML